MKGETNYWQRRMSRRTVLRGAAVGGVGLATAAVIGCGDDDEEGQPAATAAGQAPAAGQPKRGGTLAHMIGPSGPFPAGLDPHRKAGGSEGGQMGMFYQGLVQARPPGFEPEPWLATKWEQPSKTEIVFTLAPNVKWQNKAPVNGREFTAEDVVFNLKRMGTDDPTFINRHLVAPIAKAEAVDKLTVKVTTTGPDVSTLPKLAESNALMLSREAVEKWDDLATAEHVMGTGAFIMQSKDDTGAKLVRNPNFWKQGQPYLDGVNLTWIADPQARLAAFLGGQLDVVHVPGAVANDFFKQRQNDFYTDWDATPSAFHLWPNVQKSPFKDPRVYKAMSLLIDRTEVLNTWAANLFGRGQFMTYIPAARADWDYSQEEMQKNLLWKNPKDDAVKEALSLLNAAGFNKDKPLKVVMLNEFFGSLGAELLQAQYKRLSQGVVEITELEVRDFVQINGRLIAGEYDASGPTTRGNPVDLDAVFRTLQYTGGGTNFAKWSDKKADGLIDKQRTIFDEADRRKAVRELIDYLVENSPYAPWVGLLELFAVQKRVKNWVPYGQFRTLGWAFESIWLDA